jgi:hypothetical protein
MEIVFAATMDQVIAAAICLDETQVDVLLEGIEPAAPAPIPDFVAAGSADSPSLEEGNTAAAP